MFASSKTHMGARSLSPPFFNLKQEQTKPKMTSDQANTNHAQDAQDAEDDAYDDSGDDAGIDETLMTDHLMDHFATWYLVTVLSVDLLKLFFQHYNATHPAKD